MAVILTGSGRWAAVGVGVGGRREGEQEPTEAGAGRAS